MSTTLSTTPPGIPALDAGDLCAAFASTASRQRDDIALRSSDGSVELTWHEFDVHMREVAGGLSALGIAHGGTVGLLLTNRHEAAVVDMASIHLGAVPVSFYNSSSANQLGFLVDDSRADAIVTERSMAGKARDALTRSSRNPRLIIVDGDETDADADAATLSELRALGTPISSETLPRVTPDDLVTIIYTSGTTGNPKGAEITHENILSQLRGLHALGRLPAGGRTVSYLPFAHLGDRLCAYYMPIVTGATITYHADARTAGELLPEIRPTIYMSVPQLWQKVQTRAMQLIAESPAPTRTALEDAIELGGALYDDRVAGTSSTSASVEQWYEYDPQLSVLRANLGLDAAELLFTGGAPLPPETLRFFAAIGVDLCEGYGQSESGFMMCNPAGRARPVTNGVALPNVETQLADDGELLVRGPTVMAGYRGKPELTADVIDSDGWLYTGDTFTTDEAGYFRIIDRKKEIIVSSTGKNVSPTHVENTVSAASALVGSVICIGDDRPYITAIVALESTEAARLTGGAEPAASASHPAVVQQLLAAVESANRSLGRHEQVRRFIVAESAWLPGGDELTPTMKLRRKQIAQKYATAIDALYGSASDHVIDVPS